MWMNKSLKYGILIIPYWPMKLWWGSKKTFKMLFFWDFPTPHEGHPDVNVRRSYIWGGYMLPDSHAKGHSAHASH